MSTSGHGSGDNATSNLCDTLIRITWVDVDGNVRVSARDTDEARLFCGGLGLIGIMTELELQLTPPTHTKLITRYLANDTNIVSDIEKMLKVSPHILVFWRPDMRMYRCTSASRPRLLLLAAALMWLCQLWWQRCPTAVKLITPRCCTVATQCIHAQASVHRCSSR